MEYNHANEARLKASLDVAHANARANGVVGKNIGTGALIGGGATSVENEVSGLMNYLQNVLDDLGQNIEKLDGKIAPILMPVSEEKREFSVPYPQTDMGKGLVRLIERSITMRNRVGDMGDRVGL